MKQKRSSFIECMEAENVGERNEEGERIVDMVVSLDLSICNTFFKKRDYHLITY